MTLQQLITQREALLAARYRGIRTVETEGRRVTYATDAEMASALTDLERAGQQVAVLAGVERQGEADLPHLGYAAGAGLAGDGDDDRGEDADDGDDGEKLDESKALRSARRDWAGGLHLLFMCAVIWCRPDA